MSSRGLPRLKTRAEFLRVAAERRKWVARGVIVQARARTDADTAATDAKAGPLAADAVRVGFTASKKIGNAVVRNRARRRLRAAVAEIMPRHARGGMDYVLIARGETAALPFARLRDDLILALRKLNAWRDGEVAS